MEDPFKIGLKAFFGVATGVGILLLTINVIQVITQGIDSSINNFIENQEQKQREEKERLERMQRWRDGRKARIEKKKREEVRIDKLRSDEYCLDLLGFESEFLEECRKYPKEYWYEKK